MSYAMFKRAAVGFATSAALLSPAHAGYADALPPFPIGVDVDRIACGKVSVYWTYPGGPVNVYAWHPAPGSFELTGNFVHQQRGITTRSLEFPIGRRDERGREIVVLVENRFASGMRKIPVPDCYGIAVEGSGAYRDAIEYGLEHIRSRDPESWAVVQRNIRRIREYQGDRATIMEDEGTALIPFWSGDELAPTIVHEAWHGEFRRHGERYSGKPEEEKVLRKENEFMKRAGYGQLDIEAMLRHPVYNSIAP